MSFFRWLKDLVFPPPRRDVSRLDPDSDEIYENVDLSGGPLKEGHQRRALRDKRLVPKKKKAISLRKKPRHFEASQAGRLFSLSQRTCNRQLRDLDTDPEQLKRYGLPLWKTEAELAQALGLSVKELRHYSMHRYRDKVSHYVTFAIKKAGGGERHIMAPKKRLKELQRKLLRQLVDKLPDSASAHGFVKGRSVRSGAEAHVGKAVVLKLDLKDFFPSVTFGRVRGLWIAMGYSYPVATTLALLMTESVRQPVEVEGELFQVPVGHRHCVQGAPTSPGVCNAVALRLDRRLRGLAKKWGFDYTRYADDLSFSGAERSAAAGLAKAATRIIEDEGFVVNHKKTRITGQGRRQTVTGVVVNQVAGLSRQERRRLRAALHQLSLKKEKDPAEVARLKGKLAYLAMLNPDQAEALRRRYPL